MVSNGKGNNKGNFSYSNQSNFSSYIAGSSFNVNNTTTTQNQMKQSAYNDSFNQQNMQIHAFNMQNQPKLFPFYYPSNYFGPYCPFNYQYYNTHTPNHFQMPLNQNYQNCMNMKIHNDYNKGISSNCKDMKISNIGNNDTSNKESPESFTSKTSDFDDSDLKRESELLASINEVILELNCKLDLEEKSKDISSMQNGGNLNEKPYEIWLKKLSIIQSTKDKVLTTEMISDIQDNIIISITDILNNSKSKYIVILNSVIANFSQEKKAKIWKLLTASDMLVKYCTYEISYQFIDNLISQTEETQHEYIFSAFNSSLLYLSFDTYGTIIVQKLTSFNDRKCRIQSLIYNNFSNMILDNNSVKVVIAYADKIKNEPLLFEEFFSYIDTWLNLLVKNRPGISLLIKILQTAQEKSIFRIIDSLKSRFIKLSMHKSAFYFIQTLIENHVQAMNIYYDKVINLNQKKLTTLIKSRSGYNTLKKLMKMLNIDKLDAILKILKKFDEIEKNETYNHRLINLQSMEYLKKLCSDDSIDMVNESEYEI